MRLLTPILCTGLATAYYTMSVYAPSTPQVHARVINARNKAFIIGASKPSTFCDLDDAKNCPAGTSTQVDEQMTALAAAVPGGQFIFVGPDGIISYSSAHSALRPPGSQVGGFRTSQMVSECKMPVTVLVWSPEDGNPGLWASSTLALQFPNTCAIFLSMYDSPGPGPHRRTPCTPANPAEIPTRANVERRRKPCGLP
ncbi:hypothetical protein ACJ41O_014586 [Fusarium nematophilum]